MSGESWRHKVEKFEDHVLSYSITISEPGKLSKVTGYGLVECCSISSRDHNFHPSFELVHSTGNRYHGNTFTAHLHQMPSNMVAELLAIVFLFRAARFQISAWRPAVLTEVFSWFFPIPENRFWDTTLN
jgi:hypothetical protein